ncbi:hypothetical protein FGG47_gp57 [Mycobacterium phage Rebeuca]|uniref:Lipoprotein n=2 Tax=Fromanvirus rebeuca TaxID=1225862 RepID=A0A482JDR4_9CAUD|nr:hypothetical protein FGG47_gp57 [Mycobacterium phage Rebeuca]AFQ97346.1 hypothetical protein REBEUCA_38 [Mycobacterium phage Rebeuca]QBP31987.1 hypothetical protein SEA_KRISTOFF_38 [Mycobacterium phage Kristoff]
MKRLAAGLLIAASALALTACEGDTDGTYEDDGPNGVIFVPMPGNPVGTPIFF